MFRGGLAKVRAELEPWEKQLIEHKGKLDVASTESKLLNEKVRLEIQLGAFFFFFGKAFTTTSNAIRQG